jgi:hypothetical protein
MQVQINTTPAVLAQRDDVLNRALSRCQLSLANAFAMPP